MGLFRKRKTGFIDDKLRVRVRLKSVKMLDFQRFGVFLDLSDRNVDRIDGQRR